MKVHGRYAGFDNDHPRNRRDANGACRCISRKAKKKKRKKNSARRRSETSLLRRPSSVVRARDKLANSKIAHGTVNNSKWRKYFAVRLTTRKRTKTRTHPYESRLVAVAVDVVKVPRHDRDVHSGRRRRHRRRYRHITIYDRRDRDRSRHRWRGARRTSFDSPNRVASTFNLVVVHFLSFSRRLGDVAKRAADVRNSWNPSRIRLPGLRGSTYEPRSYFRFRRRIDRSRVNRSAADDPREPRATIIANVPGRAPGRRKANVREP